jgi:hypothetical protein
MSFFMRHRRIVTAVGLIILLALPAAARSRFVTTQGKDIVSPDGKPLLLKGINLGNWLLPEGYMFKFKKTNSPRLIGAAINELVGEDEGRRFWKTYYENYITEADIIFIKQAGFNSVRVPFNYRLFVSEDQPVRLEGEGYQLLDNVIAWCRKAGLYVILDMHAAPGGQTGDNIDDGWGYPFLFESSESQGLTITIWRKLAARYRDEPTVIGYDLLNEPIAHYFKDANLNPKLEPLYRRIVSGIREVDRNHLIFLGGAQWDTNFDVFGPPFDDKLVYTFHKYWMTVDQEAIAPFLAFRDRYKVPLWMGESGENTDDWIRSFRLLLEQNNIGWCFWPYKKLDATSCPVSIGVPKNWDAIVAFAEGPRSTYEEIRTKRPPANEIKQALDDYLERIKFKNCRTNNGYLQALGVK